MADNREKSHQKTAHLCFLTVAALTLSSCGGLGGRPETARLGKIAREQMVADVGPQGIDPAKRQALEEAAAAAMITKNGICATGKNNVYGCAAGSKRPQANQSNGQSNTPPPASAPMTRGQ